MLKYLSSVIVALALLCVPFAAHAEDFKLGKNYHEISKPMKLQDTDKIEILMFLWYGCSGCYKLDDKIVAWAEKLPDDVSFKRVPAYFFPQWEFHGRVFLAMDAIGATYAQHHAVFDLIQKDKVKLESEADLPALFAKTGVDKDKFMAVFNDPNTIEKLEELQTQMFEYGIQAVPALVINGKYRYTVKDTEGPHFIELADYLINLERNAKSK